MNVHLPAFFQAFHMDSLITVEQLLIDNYLCPPLDIFFNLLFLYNPPLNLASPSQFLVLSHKQKALCKYLFGINILSLFFLEPKKKKTGGREKNHQPSQLRYSMAKERRNLNSWLEVAPAPIIYPQKPSNSPGLETIAEEASEECENKSGIGRLSSRPPNFGSLKVKKCPRF